MVASPGAGGGVTLLRQLHDEVPRWDALQDELLLKVLQGIKSELVQKAEKVEQRILDATRRADDVHVRLRVAVSRLEVLSQRQFIEHGVAEAADEADDVSGPAADDFGAAVPSHPLGVADQTERQAIQRALSIGQRFVESGIQPRQWRPLPPIVGSQEFWAATRGRDSAAPEEGIADDSIIEGSVADVQDTQASDVAAADVGAEAHEPEESSACHGDDAGSEDAKGNSAETRAPTPQTVEEQLRALFAGKGSDATGDQDASAGAERSTSKAAGKSSGKGPAGKGPGKDSGKKSAKIPSALLPGSDNADSLFATNPLGSNQKADGAEARGAAASLFDDDFVPPPAKQRSPQARGGSSSLFDSGASLFKDGPQLPSPKRSTNSGAKASSLFDDDIVPNVRPSRPSVTPQPSSSSLFDEDTPQSKQGGERKSASFFGETRVLDQRPAPRKNTTSNAADPLAVRGASADGSPPGQASSPSAPTSDAMKLSKNAQPRSPPPADRFGSLFGDDAGDAARPRSKVASKSVASLFEDEPSQSIASPAGGESNNTTIRPSALATPPALNKVPGALKAAGLFGDDPSGSQDLRKKREVVKQVSFFDEKGVLSPVDSPAASSSAPRPQASLFPEKPSTYAAGTMRLDPSLAASLFGDDPPASSTRGPMGAIKASSIFDDDDDQPSIGAPMPTAGNPRNTSLFADPGQRAASRPPAAEGPLAAKATTSPEFPARVRGHDSAASSTNVAATPGADPLLVRQTSPPRGATASANASSSIPQQPTQPVLLGADANNSTVAPRKPQPGVDTVQPSRSSAQGFRATADLFGDAEDLMVPVVKAGGASASDGRALSFASAKNSLFGDDALAGPQSQSPTSSLFGVKPLLQPRQSLRGGSINTISLFDDKQPVSAQPHVRSTARTTKAADSTPEAERRLRQPEDSASGPSQGRAMGSAASSPGSAALHGEGVENAQSAVAKHQPVEAPGQVDRSPGERPITSSLFGASRSGVASVFDDDEAWATSCSQRRARRWQAIWTGFCSLRLPRALRRLSAERDLPRQVCLVHLPKARPCLARDHPRGQQPHRCSHRRPNNQVRRHQHRPMSRRKNNSFLDQPRWGRLRRIQPGSDQRRHHPRRRSRTCSDQQ